MKKVFFIIALATGSVATNAQNSNVSFGLKGGLNVYNFTGNNVQEYSSRKSFHVGGLAHIHLSNTIAVQPEVYFSGQGAKVKLPSGDIKINLNYVNVPVLLQYMMASGLRLETGPQVGFLVSAKNKAGGNEADSKSEFKTVDFA